MPDVLIEEWWSYFGELDLERQQWVVRADCSDGRTLALVMPSNQGVRAAEAAMNVYLRALTERDYRQIHR